MVVTESMIIAIVIAIAGLILILLLIHLALSGRMEKLLESFLSHRRESQQGLEPLRLRDLSNETQGETWGDVKLRK